MLKKAGNLFTTAYLLLIFGIYPLYMNRGYVDIGEAKYHFFIYSSLAALLILGLIGGAGAVQIMYRRLKAGEPYLIHWERVSVTDLFVMLYATEIFVSYAFSDYRKEALWGTEGWYMGTILLLTLCGLYFLISRLWEGGRAIWYAAAAASGIVFLLGISDRFSLYLLPLEIRQPSFISTLGNINWFCGYLSVLSPVGISLFLFSEKKDNFIRVICGIYTVIAFMAGFCQGSSSIFLFFGALFYILLWISVKKGAWLADYFLVLSLWGFSAQLVRIIGVIVPDGYNYDRDNLCAYLTSSDLTLTIGIGAFCVYAFLRLGGKKDLSKKAQKSVHFVMAGLLTAGILLWLVLAVINTRFGIPGLAQWDGLLLNEGWGNGRGAAFYSGFQMYRQMPVFRKLFGIGPDCFSAYAYSLPEVAEVLRSNFGNNRLTNAHNELLTGLVNTGAFGVSLMISVFASFVRGCMKKGKETPAFYMFAVCIICYFTHNMVSFAQVLNFPFLFLLLGMGEALRR